MFLFCICDLKNLYLCNEHRKLISTCETSQSAMPSLNSGYVLFCYFFILNFTFCSVFLRFVILHKYMFFTSRVGAEDIEPLGHR